MTDQLFDLTEGVCGVHWNRRLQGFAPTIWSDVDRNMRSQGAPFTLIRRAPAAAAYIMFTTYAPRDSWAQALRAHANLHPGIRKRTRAHVGNRHLSI